MGAGGFSPWAKPSSVGRRLGRPRRGALGLVAGDGRRGQRGRCPRSMQRKQTGNLALASPGDGRKRAELDQAASEATNWRRCSGGSAAWRGERSTRARRSFPSRTEMSGRGRSRARRRQRGLGEAPGPRDLGATPARDLGGGEDRERRRWPGLDGSGRRLDLAVIGAPGRPGCSCPTEKTGRAEEVRETGRRGRTAERARRGPSCWLAPAWWRGRVGGDEFGGAQRRNLGRRRRQGLPAAWPDAEEGGPAGARVSRASDPAGVKELLAAGLVL